MPSRRMTSSASRASTCGPIGCRLSSSATRRCSPSNSPASGFDQYERIALSDLDLGSADLKRHGPPANRYRAGRVHVDVPRPAAPHGRANRADRERRAGRIGSRRDRARRQGQGRYRQTAVDPNRQGDGDDDDGWGGCGSGDLRHHVVHPVPRFLPRRRDDRVGPRRPCVQRWRVLGERRARYPIGTGGRGRSDARAPCSAMSSGCCWRSPTGRCPPRVSPTSSRRAAASPLLVSVAVPCRRSFCCSTPRRI